MAQVLKAKDIKIEEKLLHTPCLNELSAVIKAGLQSNFEEVIVEVVDCPDLTQKPFYLKTSGLGGCTSLLELGGAPYLLPTVQRDKLYDIKDILETINLDPASVIGAGAGPWPYANTNCEGIYNLSFKDGKISNNSHIAIVNTENGECDLQTLPDDETRCALLANLFLSNGSPGKVLKVHCKIRTGNDDFIASIRKSLENHYSDQVVGLGGTFLLKEGKAKQHVMRDFSKTPINTEDELNTWLKFFDMEAPLIAVGTLVNQVTDLDLRVQHFHSFSDHGLGGHYHIDTTPETVEYLGYFNVGEKVIRIDRPIETHMMGRD